MTDKLYFFIHIFLSVIYCANAFSVFRFSAPNRVISSRIYAEEESKGFGVPKPIASETEPKEKDAGTKTYEAQAQRGIPEYNIFMRTRGGEAEEWVPVGSMTIPRDVPVARAVYEVEQELLAGTFKLYPKMKAFYDVRKEEDKANTFEYGCCLKAFPDEEIKILNKEDAYAKKGNFFQNWLGSVTNPNDNSELKNPGQMGLKQ
jgi:hypothetical protein